MTTPTWRHLTAQEPRLRHLYAEIRAVKDDKSEPGFCANWVWYGSFKKQMCALVGFQADNPNLRTMEAYDHAYHKLYNALPDCRNCYCIGMI
jgi:hypothetical protein